jgi:formylglycine-generating enzyme required for sulfatase activity
VAHRRWPHPPKPAGSKAPAAWSTWAGAVGEYNGIFMVGQLVLRGSSLFTPTGHSRTSDRNFFPPATRFQASGLRLAQDR